MNSNTSESNPDFLPLLVDKLLDDCHGISEEACDSLIYYLYSIGRLDLYNENRVDGSEGRVYYRENS